MTTLQRLRRMVPLLALVAAAGAAQPLEAQTPATAQVMSQGSGWKLVEADPAGGSANTLLWEVSRSGVAGLPVSQAQKDLLYAAFADAPDGTNDVIFFSQELLAAMEQPDFPAGYEPYIEYQAASTESSSGEPVAEGFSFGCSWKTETRNRSWPYEQNLFDRNFPFSGGVSGQLSLNLPISGQVQVAATYKIRKCAGVPVGFKFVSATASGNAMIAGSGHLEASASAAATWQNEWKLAEPSLGSVSFTVGWIPVRLVFTLPVYAGAALEARIAGNLSAQLDASASGTFSYTCTTSTCSGTSNFTDQFEFTGPSASATVDLKATAHARVMLRVGLYSSSFAYVEGGAKAYARAGIWGYIGNTCGDGDLSGSNEGVEALAADLWWGYQFAYGLGGWLLPDQVRYTGGREYLIGWRDLLGTGGSTALSPMIHGPAVVDVGETASYTIKARPCYPYTQNVAFTMEPAPWTGVAPFTPPAGGATVSRSFSTPGTYTLRATLTSDTYGRNIQVPYSRTIEVRSPAPDAPSGLVATALSPTSVRLNWSDNSNNETSFQVQRAIGYGSFTHVAWLGANTATWTDASAQPGTSYRYRVRAWNGSSASTFATSAIVTTSMPVPAAPSGLTASYSSVSRRYTLRWQDNATDEQGFHLQFSYSGSAFSNLYPSTVGANVTSFLGGYNPPAGTYQFRVRAYNANGYSAWSNVASLTVNATPTASIAWIQPAESSWGPAGTLTAAGHARNGSGTVQLVWRERNDAGYWGGWNVVAYQATPAADGSWSNTISSGNPTNKCHWFEAYVNYSGVQSAVYRYTGDPGCAPPASASIAWIQPAESSWGPAGTLTAAGYARDGSGGVQLVWRERGSSGVWGPWTTVAYKPYPSADGTWSNTISSGNPTDKCHWFDAYVNYAGVTSPVFRYSGAPGCP